MSDTDIPDWSCGSCPWFERYTVKALNGGGDVYLLDRYQSPAGDSEPSDRGICIGSTPPFAGVTDGDRCAVHPDAPSPDAGWLRRVEAELERREGLPAPAGPSSSVHTRSDKSAPPDGGTDREQVDIRTTEEGRDEKN